jgi:hypothetical protein
MAMLGIRGLHLWCWVTWGMLRYVSIVTKLGISARIFTSYVMIWRLVVVLVVAVVEAVAAEMAADTMAGVLH